MLDSRIRILSIGLFLTIMCLAVPAIGQEQRESDKTESIVEQNTSVLPDHSNEKTPSNNEEEKIQRGLTANRVPLVDHDGIVFDISAEYRLRNIYIKPLELNNDGVEDLFYSVQRARTGWMFSYQDHVKIVAGIDLLDGVLFGDNGLLVGQSPYPNEGISTSARSPNNAGLQLIPIEGGDDQDSHSYTYGLKEIEPVKVRRLWAEVDLVAAVLRVGRMASQEGRGILLNDGDNDLNRFGTTDQGDTSDRIMIGTKPIEVIKAMAAGNSDAADPREDRGLFFGVAYDHLVEDMVQFNTDDAYQVGTSLYYRLPDYSLNGVDGGGLHAGLSYANRWSKAVKLNLNILAAELRFGIENFRFESQAGFLIGKTREVSDAQSMFRIETNPTVQDIFAWGLMAIADYDIGPVTLTMEFDMATGDSNPRHDSTLEHFYFADDTKVGLLLFPHVLAFETAKSAAAAEAFLKDAGSTSLPSTQIASGGAFTNAIAVFPQATWNITDSIFIRMGALFAWAETPVIDPYETLHHWDGSDLKDDYVNYNDGKPGDYYGTELDARFSVKLWDDHFMFDLEGAVLFPGSALKDEHGHVATSGLVEGRFTFRF